MYNFIDLLASASGRASRRHWWAALISYYLGLYIAIILPSYFDSMLIGLFSYALGLACVGGYFVISIRRFHDQNKSGLWILLPIVNPVFLAFVPGDAGKNNYGKPFHLRKQPPDRSISDSYT